MEEELNENELEEQFYSMLHYVDDSQANVATDQNAAKILENAPRGTMRRYWRTSGERASAPAAGPINTPFQKVNIPAEAPKHTNNNKSQKSDTTDNSKPKEEKCCSPVEQLPQHLSLFQSPIPPNMKKIVEIIDTEEKFVELESSDEDEVIEVALPPKPTITIESSDDEITIQDTPTKAKLVQEKRSRDRDVSASPVPSIVSSVSDEFIRGDCIALNISSRRPDNQSFDFSLHGPDLGGTPAKKKKKKKKKNTSTPVTIDFTEPTSPVFDKCFATPKSKAKKNSKKRTKSFTVATENSIPSVDVYDSDSNQSIVELNRKNNSYAVTEKSLPCADVYETDSNQSEIPKNTEKAIVAQNNNISSDSSVLSDIPVATNTILTDLTSQVTETITIDLTDQSTNKNDDINESIVIGNVSGFMKPDHNEPVNETQVVPKFGSTKVPAILYENLDFDNLKGKEKVCKNRRYSLTTLRAEMEKFYNESWGGEDFNHREIQKNMSRDQSLWAIDPKDRMTSFSRKKFTVCNYCNRSGHRDDACHLKPLVCYMCGNTGHVEPRCPSKICVNCGAPNYMYSSQCRNCAGWRGVACAECGQRGHPSSHCPDLWRRYHNTTEYTSELQENRFMKKYNQLCCSGCTRRGHLIHTCRSSIPFSGLPINSPFVYMYRNVYPPPSNWDNQRHNQSYTNKSFERQQDSTISSGTTTPKTVKRQSKSPAPQEANIKKKKKLSLDDVLLQKENNSTLETEASNETETTKTTTPITPTVPGPEKALDFIPIFSNNHDKKGRVIQDNEVSDTSDVVTSARIYVTNDIIDKLKTKEGADWLKETAEKLDVIVENANINSFLSIKGKLDGQEAFQTALRDWAGDGPKTHQTKSNISDCPPQSDKQVCDIPKKKNELLREVSKALDSLKTDLGKPDELLRQLRFFRSHHGKLLKQKVINPKKLENSSNKINNILKKLNMILLGQAGLAGGSRHLQKLHDLRIKLTNCRQKNISPELRKEIWEHYHSIFSFIPRDDYDKLIGIYKSHSRSGNASKEQVKKHAKKFNAIPITNQENRIESKAKKAKKNKNDFNYQPRNASISADLSKKIRLQLVPLYRKQRKLKQSQPFDLVMKRTKIELLKLVGQLIGSLKNDVKTPQVSNNQLSEFHNQVNLFLEKSKM